MLETLFSGINENGLFLYNCSYLSYIKRALVLSCVVVAFSSPLMPYLTLFQGVSTATGVAVSYAKLGIIHALTMSVQHLVLTPTEHASIAIISNGGVFWVSLKQFTCLQDAFVGNLMDPKDLKYLGFPELPEILSGEPIGLELADSLQHYVANFDPLTNMELCCKFLILV
jgi:hypothetical protein